MNVHVNTYSDQAERLSSVVATAELAFWKDEAKRLREDMELAAIDAVKGKPVTLVYKDRIVKLIPENTAARMSGEIP